MMSNTSPSSERPEICILLAVYQGASYLQTQLNSFAAQTHRNWSLVASDDGSSDDSPAILERFRQAHGTHRISLLQGPGKGFARNFLFLLRKTPPETAFAALSDQDDIWFPHKLDRAVRLLSELPPGQPGLYCARTMICAENLAPIGLSQQFRHAPDFRNALVQSIGGGNTMVLNHAALALVQETLDETTAPVAHDWWLYQIITGCGGQVIYDPEPILSYRQHGDNQIGANLSLRAKLLRFLALAQGRFQDWNEIGLEALEKSAHRFTPQARETLDHYKAARSGPILQRLKSLKASGAYRQSAAGTIALYIACLLNRI